MRTRSLSFLIIVASATMLGGQSSLPADIHPESLSRLPPVQRSELNEDGKRIYDSIASGGRGMPKTGPAAVSMHSPKAAESIQALNQYLRTTVVGADSLSCLRSSPPVNSISSTSGQGTSQPPCVRVSNRRSSTS